MKKHLLYVCLIVITFSQTLYAQTAPQHNKKVIGYYAQWAIYARDYNVLDIEADKLTHLLYAFFDTKYDAATDSGYIQTLDDYADFQHNESGLHAFDAPVKGNIGDLKLLKQNYPHLKVIISLGGWTRSQAFPDIAKSANARTTLAQSMVDFMTNYPWIDGFDLDWEFPVQGGIDGTESVGGVLIPAQPHYPDDHKNLVLLLKEMRTVFDANSMQNKIISMAAGNNVTNLLPTHVGPGTEAMHGVTENVFDYCDFVTFFGYDFGGNWYDKTCYNAPLYGGDHAEDPLNRGTGNPNQVMDGLVGLYLNGLQVPTDKLVMGIPFYGKLFEGVANTGAVSGLPGLYEAAPRTNNPACNNPQPPQGTWDAANCENSGSIEFCDLFQGIGTNTHHYLDTTNPLQVSSAAAASGWARYWDDTAKVPYLYNATTNKFISYDDNESIDLKVKYALSKNLGGVMIWELSQDARNNSSNSLLNTIDNSLQFADYDLTINFKDAANNPLQGVVVELKDENNTVLETLTANAFGQVVFANKPGNVPYTVTYTLTNYAFLPNSITYAALEFNEDKVVNVTGSDQLVSITGSVTENNVLLTDVDIVLKDTTTGNELSRVTSADGNYSFTDVISGNDYTITAEKDFFSFTSLVHANVTTNLTNQEILATRNTHTISGTILAGANPLQGVTVTVSGNGQNYTDTTDASGSYVIANLLAGYNYTVTPNLNSIVFLPANAQANALDADQTFNFVQNLGLVYGTVKNGSAPVGGAIVTLIMPWTDASHPYVALTATTNAQGEYYFTETQMDGYATISSLKLNDYENNGVVYQPTDIANIPVPTTATEYNFNSQPVSPEITINQPNQSVVSIASGGTVNLEALVGLTFNDGTTTLSSVTFDVNGTTITHSNTSNTYAGVWTPLNSDFGASHTFTVTAEDSNGVSVTEMFTFSLECSGVGCPNIPPTITLNAPTSTTLNQNGGFQNIPIEVTVTDTDGTVASVTITINGNTVAMVAGANNTYSYTFTPTAYQSYPMVITAVDNEGDSSTLNESLTIIDSIFTPLPSGNIVLGYAHSWENASAPFLYFNEMQNTKFNVVMYSFIETVGQNGYTPQLTINSNRYLTNGVFDSQLLKDDINVLRSQGIPVIASIGGQNGHVELSTTAQKDEFVQGLKDIIDEYQFDGIDLDFEGGSMNFGAGALTDFSYASLSPYPKLKNVVDAFKELKQHYGSNFIMTCAPETFYVQVGYSTYSGIAGAFLPVIHNLRDELDLIMVQLYNTGSINALDGTAYSQATPDFLTSMTDMLITGFNVSTTGFNFSGLPASKIMVGIPSCPAAAPAGGYIQPTEAIKALDYLRFGTDFTGRNYTLQNGNHPNLRGVMTWSINWDVAAGCASANEFGNSYWNYFNATLGALPKVYLQGAALNPNTGEETLMRDDLRVEGLLPTTSPYSIAPATCNASVFNTTGPDAIVDWVLVELRNAADNTAVVIQQSALLQRDGDVVATDGVSPLSFTQTAGNYYVAIKHYNHLAIMTTNTIALSGVARTIDFTDASNLITYGTNAQTSFGMPSGLLGMWGGDANGDGKLNYLGAVSDVPAIRSQVFNDPDNSIFGGPAVATYPSQGYSPTDVNLSGYTLYSGSSSDVLYIRNNIFNNPSNAVFGGPPVPTFIFEQQLPEGGN
ncbi:glycosyl hydrolase family 18 protein [Pontimicrobium sp. MEBiC01747]